MRLPTLRPLLPTGNAFVAGHPSVAMPRTALGAAVAAVGLVLAGLAAWGLWMEVPHFWDPCYDWGVGGRGSGSYEVGFTQECPDRREGTSETKLGAAVRLTLVHGVGLAAGGLAVVGGWRRRPLPVLVAGLLMAGETVILFLGISAAIALTLPAAVLFLTTWARWRATPPPAPSQPL